MEQSSTLVRDGIGMVDAAFITRGPIDIIIIGVADKLIAA